MMGKGTFISLALLLLATPEIQAQDSLRMIGIEGVEVTAQRRLVDTGVTKTDLDTLALRDNVINSLADVLSQNSPVFIKSYGRGTLSTASFRGTSPSHTQVLWNGMKLNSPMLGMVDFSQIPSFFIDEAKLYHGGSSVNVAGGAMGGAVVLGTKPSQEEGFGLHFIQGIGSFATYDEFLRLDYGSGRLRSATRVSYTTSHNDFKYTGFSRDDDGNNPTLKNKNGGYNDLHVMQEFYYTSHRGDRFSLAAWYMRSDRNIPMLNTDERDENQLKNTQKENVLRAVGSWERINNGLKLNAKAGYVYSDMNYSVIARAYGSEGTMNEKLRSQSVVNTAFGEFTADHTFSDRLMLTGTISLNYHSVSSAQRENAIKEGYDKSRLEGSVLASAKYRPLSFIGLAADLRAESYGGKFTPVIPAVFAEVSVWKGLNLVAKGSAARNYRYPTLNDLYYKPGGNDTLRCEKGFTYDAGIELGVRRKRISLTAGITAYDSRVKDWILWLPSQDGYWSPRNIRRVHSYGYELTGKLFADLGRRWTLHMDFLMGTAHSKHQGDPVSEYDISPGKQLPFVPVNSSSLTGKLCWRDYMLTYKYNYYGKRFATTDNDPMLMVIKPYYMSDVSVERMLRMSDADISLRFSVFNLFGEPYETVLSRPMPGRHFGIYIGITPKLQKRKK